MAKMLSKPRKKNSFAKNIFEKLQSKGGRGTTTIQGSPKSRPLAVMGKGKF